MALLAPNGKSSNLTPDITYKVGGRTIAQTPAPKSDRIYGSKENIEGSASTEGSNIKLSEKTVEVLKEKLKEFKEKHPRADNITLSDLKKVYRRGSGAYSKSHRPTITGGVPNTRAAWSFARVNKFLEKAAGHKVKKAYVQDDDLLKYADGGLIAPNGKPSNLTPEQYKLVRTPAFKAWFGFWEENLLIDNFLSDRGFVVGSGMALSISNSKILDSIISFIPIDVMHKFGTKEFAIEMLLHDKSMFVDILSLSQRDSFIISFINESIIFITITRAKLSNTEPTSSNAEMFSTLNTLQNNLIFVINNLVFSSKFSAFYDVSPFAVVRAKFFVSGSNPTLDAIIHNNSISDKDKQYYTTLQTNSLNISKVVDENGEPMVVYHGSREKGINIFDSDKAGSVQYSDWGKGIYFTPSKSKANYYSNEAIIKSDKLYNEYYEIYERTKNDEDLKKFQKRGSELFANKDTIVYSVFLNIINPLEEVVDSMNYTDPSLSKKAIKQNKDGVIILNGRYDFDELLVFYPNQIKLADGTNTTFDAANPDIRYAGGGTLKELYEKGNFVYLRFGLPNKDELGNYKNSYRHYFGLEGTEEGGISVFEALKHYNKYYVFLNTPALRNSFSELKKYSDRDLYLVKGDFTDNEGADGEILLDPKTFKVIKKIDKKDVIEYNPDIRYEDGGELSDQVWYHKYSGEPFQYQKGSHNKYGDGIYFSNQQDSRFDGDEEIECIVKFKNPIVFEGRGLPNLKFHKARGKKTINDFADELFQEHDAIIVKHGGKFGDELIIRDANIISKKISHKHKNINVEKFIEQYKAWHKKVNSKLSVHLSCPNEFSKPVSDMPNDSLIIDLFQKKEDSVDVGLYLHELLSIADANGITLYILPIPQNKSEYYKNFGFVEIGNGFMERRVLNSSHIRYEYGGATDFRVYRGYHPSKNFAEGGVSGRIDNAIDNKVNLSREQIADARLLAKQKINNEATNEPLQEAIQYNEYYGFPPLTLHKYKPSEKELQTEIAEIYPHLIGVTSPDYVETELERGIYNQYKSAYPEIFEEYKIKNYKDLVLKAYNQLAYEIDEQYRTLPIKVEYHQGDENYENSAEMFDDVHNYHHMWVYLGGEDHPTLGSITRDENGLTANDKFRAVHDYYGHAVGGYEFGKNGEENAWIEHSKMLSPLAQWALSTESRGQNSYVNFSGINDAVLKRIERGSSLKKEGLKLKDEAMVAEGQAILNTVYDDFVFAEQKAIILPLKYTDFSRYHQPVIDYVPKKLNIANRYAGGGRVYSDGVEVPSDIDALLKEKSVYDKEVDELSSKLQKLANENPSPLGLGLVSDKLKNDKDWIDLNNRYRRAFNALRDFNSSEKGKKIQNYQKKIGLVKRMELRKMYKYGGTTNKNLNLKNMQNKYHSLKPIDGVEIGDTYLLHEECFSSSGEHKGERFITVEVVKPSEYTIGDYELKVLDCKYSGTTPYYKGNVIHRGKKYLIRTAKLVDKAKKKSEAETPSFKDGGINPDSKEVKEYFGHQSGDAGGLLVGKRHSEEGGGIKAHVKSTGQQILMEGGEAVITRGAVNSPKKYSYQGKQMTTREILSDLNVKGGGVSFAEGGDVPDKIKCGCSHMEVGGINYGVQDFITLAEKEYEEQRLIDGIEKERKDHFYTLAKLNAGAITIEQALREIAVKEMFLNPAYPYGG